MFINLWRRYFPERVVEAQRPTDLASDIAAFESMQRAYVDRLCDAESRTRLEERKAGLTQKLKYDESTDSLLDL